MSAWVNSRWWWCLVVSCASVLYNEIGLCQIGRRVELVPGVI